MFIIFFETMILFHTKPNSNLVLIDLKSQAALLVILSKLAQLWILFGISQQTLFQIRIMGINFSKVIVFVKVELGVLLLSCNS